VSSEPPTSPPSASPRRFALYLAAFAGSAAAALALIVGFNFVMDPYAVWRVAWPGFNQARLWVHTDNGPPATVAFHRPRALILGNSQAAIGFDPRGAALAAWGAPLVVAHETTSYDFETQALEMAARQPGFAFALVEIDERQLKACQWTTPHIPPVTAAARLLSLSVLPDSFMTLKMSLGADLHGKAPVPYERSDGLVIIPTRLAGPAALLKEDYPSRMLGAVDEACADQADRRLEALARLARERHFSLIFFFVPWRLEMLRQSFAEGYWPRLEELRRRLAAIAIRTGAPVWDFSTATLHPQSGVTDGDFYDSFHFKPALGERLLMAMRPAAPSQPALAVQLTPANVEAVLAADRQAITSLGSGAFARP
jgi:hypothetical protein